MSDPHRDTVLPPTPAPAPDETPTLSRRGALSALGLMIPFAAGYAPAASAAAAVANPFADPDARPASIRLDSNENPYGPGPRAREAAVASIAEGCRYADADIAPLAQALAARERLDPDQVLLGSGSGELLHMVALAAAAAGPGHIVAAQPTFEEIGEFGAKFGLTTKWVPLDAGHRHDLKAMLAAIGPETRLVYVCNPNNPTSTVVPRADLVEFIRAVPRSTLILVDEAYIDFVTDPSAGPVADLVGTQPNLVVSRTFSKLHGLAGLRMGFGFAPAPLAAQLGARQLAFPNVAALRAARASLADQRFQDTTRRSILADRARVEALVDHLGYARSAAQGNFVFFDTGRPVAEFRSALRERGIKVGRTFAGYDNWSRVTVGTTPEIDRLLVAMTDVLRRRA